MKVFPVDLAAQPRPYYASAFNEQHRGIDIFAPKETNVFAVEDGQVRKDDDPKGGIVAYLKTSDGSTYYFAHLSEFIGASPRTVKAGEVIGAVGTTGNAVGKAPHVHFQVQLPEIGTVDPYPFLLDVDPQGRARKQSALKVTKARWLPVVLLLAATGTGLWLLLRTRKSNDEVLT